MQPTALTFHELVSPTEPLLPEWLRLYETAFPASERVLCSTWLRILQARAAGEPQAQAMLAALCDGRFAGLASYVLMPQVRAGYLVYLATAPELRGLGLGAAVYGEVLRRVKEGCEGLRGVVFEVELPEAASTADPDLARRRIGFYQRLGARLLRGIEYWQGNELQEPIQMHVMVHPLEGMTAAEAVEMAEGVLAGIRRVGEPGWE